MEKLALLLPALCPGVGQGAVISTATASTPAASATLTLPLLPLQKPSFGISLPRANHKGEQPPQIKCTPYRLTIRGHSSNSGHQDFSMTCFHTGTLGSWLFRLGHWLPADQLCTKSTAGLQQTGPVHPPRQAHRSAGKYTDAAVLRPASPGCLGMI